MRISRRGPGPCTLVATLCSVLLACTCHAGPVQVTQDEQKLVLGNGLAEYELDAAAGYPLSAVRLPGTPKTILLDQAQFLYIEGRTWVRESGTPEPEAETDRFVTDDLQTEGDAQRSTVRIVRHNSKLRVTKSFTLSADDPVLDLVYEITPIAAHQVNWGYTTMLWLSTREKVWLCPRNEVRGGEVVQAVSEGLPPEGATVGNKPWSLLPDPWAGVRDAQTGQGIIVLKGPGEGLDLRPGEQGKLGFIGLRFSNFPAFDPNAAEQTPLVGRLALLPFADDPEPELQAALRDHGKADLGPEFPRKAESGAVLSAGDDLTLCYDVPTSKVFRDEPPPAGQADAVQLWSARAEYEPFQLVVRPARELAQVRLECSALSGAVGTIPAANLSWHPLEYYHSSEQMRTSGFVGDVPDTLLPDRSVTCPAGVNQPLWVTVRVPEDAAPGDYRGAVRLMAGDVEIATVPVSLHVWDFALPADRSLTVWAPVWRGILSDYYGQERARELLAVYEQNTAAHRCGEHRSREDPVITWDEEGNVTGADFAAFDEGLNELVARDRMPTIQQSFFTIGYGHVPRDNRFGKAEEILTPLWRKKCEGYARALSEHLEGLGLNDRIVMSLFDEPHAEYYPMIRDVVALLRGVEPRWRFTFWGIYAEELVGSIDVWTVPMSRFSPSLAEQVRARGEEIWVYNPPAYYIDDTAMSVRTVYWWVWRQRVPLVFQWTTNAWVEWTGNTARWDPHRNASWVLPGENGPINTVRFELTREGLEDYEYLVMLEALAERTGNEEARTLLQRAREIAWTSEDEKRAFLHSQDQTELHGLRREIGSLIEKLVQE